VRRPNDVKYLKNLPGFVLVEISADSQTRYERLTKRGEKSDDNTKTYEEFLADEQRSTEITINKIAKEATEHVDNNGSLEDLYRQLDELIKKYQA
jgi:dephospho-CoA kinase